MARKENRKLQRKGCFQKGESAHLRISPGFLGRNRLKSYIESKESEEQEVFFGTIRKKDGFSLMFPFVLEIKKQIPFRCNSIVMPVQKKVKREMKRREKISAKAQVAV